MKTPFDDFDSDELAILREAQDSVSSKAEWEEIIAADAAYQIEIADEEELLAIPGMPKHYDSQIHALRLMFRR